MLTSLALNYYYLNTSISTTTIFDKIYKSIQTYFEKAKYKKKYII